MFLYKCPQVATKINYCSFYSIRKTNITHKLLFSLSQFKEMRSPILCEAPLKYRSVMSSFCLLKHILALTKLANKDPHSFVPHLTGVFPTQERASTDHVLCDPEVVIVPAVGKDVHIHRPQYRGQSVAVEPSHTPATDCASSEFCQRWRAPVRQRGRRDPGVDDSWTIQLSKRGRISQSRLIALSDGSIVHFLFTFESQGDCLFSIHVGVID